jgi:DUF1680 family protein
MKNHTPVLFLFILCACSDNTGKQKQCSDELERRIEKITSRIVSGTEPTFTSDFILADVSLDPSFQRRFINFSGDISGRYLSVFSEFNLKNPDVNIHDLVKSVIANQRSDGRFGSDSLIFQAGKLQNNHMALLWGNGRLLVGLLDYYDAYADTGSLDAAVKLGDFLMGVGGSCLDPSVAEQFKFQAAMGYICYTQLIEGLVKLYQHTHKKAYLDYAARIYPVLPERGTQHSHGYLSTLRGIVMLYSETENPEELAFVTRAYDDLVHSNDYLITGGVPEYFGDYNAKEGLRDEGCSIADFLMLSLDLWRLTEQTGYLEYAEHCLVNQMFLNQFQTGDFGHHHIKPGYGFISSPIEGRAWWCCDFHGLTALKTAQQSVFTAKNGRCQVNLFYESGMEADGIALKLIRHGQGESFTVLVNKAPEKGLNLDIRVPIWARLKAISYNGKNVTSKIRNGYAILDFPLKKGDKITVKMAYKSVIHAIDGVHELSFYNGKRVNGVLQYGPWLLGADDVFSEAFISEPSMENIVFLPVDPGANNHASMNEIPLTSNLAEAYFTVPYRHEGFYESATVTLRPVSEYSWQKPGNLRLWMNYEIQSVSDQ